MRRLCLTSTFDRPQLLRGTRSVLAYGIACSARWPCTQRTTRRLYCNRVGFLRRTETCLFLPPPIARALGAAGLVLLQSFLLAYRREAQRLREDAKEDNREGRTGAPSSTERPQMTSLEALQILGLCDGASANGSRPVQLPLTSEIERDKARENFARMMEVARAEGNWFLAGKLSAAYRLCVDGKWDTPHDT